MEDVLLPLVICSILFIGLPWPMNAAGMTAEALMDARELAQELPGRLNRFLDLLSKG